MYDFLIAGGLLLALTGLVGKATTGPDHEGFFREERQPTIPSIQQLMTAGTASLKGGIDLVRKIAAAVKEANESPLPPQQRGLLDSIMGEKPRFFHGEPRSGQDNLVAQKTASGRVYWVQKLPGRVEIAELFERLDILKHKLVVFCRRMGVFENLVRKASQIDLRESWPDSGDSTTSYTMQKVSIILCARSSDHKPLSYAKACYPYLHEVAHVVCDEAHHHENFWIIFRCIQLVARVLGWWDAGRELDFSYCRIGMRVSHQMPEIPVMNGRAFLDIVNDLIRHKGIPPADYWRKKQASNPVINAIMSKIPENDR